jgi:ABC-type thiamin/hydroxymethylpyrimidine transport system permease subunit
MTELLKLAVGALASAAVVAGILTSLISRLSRPGGDGKKSPAGRVL